MQRVFQLVPFTPDVVKVAGLRVADSAEPVQVKLALTDLIASPDSCGADRGPATPERAEETEDPDHERDNSAIIHIVPRFVGSGWSDRRDSSGRSLELQSAALHVKDAAGHGG